MKHTRLKNSIIIIFLLIFALSIVSFCIFLIFSQHEEVVNSKEVKITSLSADEVIKRFPSARERIKGGSYYLLESKGKGLWDGETERLESGIERVLMIVSRNALLIETEDGSEPTFKWLSGAEIVKNKNKGKIAENSKGGFIWQK